MNVSPPRPREPISVTKAEEPGDSEDFKDHSASDRELDVTQLNLRSKRILHDIDRIKNALHENTKNMAAIGKKMDDFAETMKAETKRVTDELESLGDRVDTSLGHVQSILESQVKILASLKSINSKVDEVHDKLTGEVTGLHKKVDATNEDLALAKAKWIGWRAGGLLLGLGVLEAISRALGGGGILALPRQPGTAPQIESTPVAGPR